MNKIYNPKQVSIYVIYIIMKTIKYIFLFLIANVIILKADDSDIGNYGYNLVAMKQSKVQMVKEIVYIKIEENSYNVHCKFWFYNHGETVNLQVGFPDFIFDSYPYETPIQNFKSLVNDKSVKLEYKNIDGKYTLQKSVFKKNDTTREYDTIRDNWYIKSVEFPEKDTVIIEDYYECDSGNTLVHAFSSISFINYVIGTGATWYKNIMDGLIIFDYTDFRSSDFIRNSEKILKTNNIKTTISENITTFEFKDYKPPKDQKLSLELYQYFYFYYESETESYDEKLQHLLNDSIDFNYKPINYIDEIKNNFNYIKLERMSKEIMARQGYIFDDNVDNEYYKQKTWYKPKKINKDSSDYKYIIGESKGILSLKMFCNKNKPDIPPTNIREKETLKLREIFKLK